MKTIFFAIALIFSILSFGQNNPSNGLEIQKTEVHNLSVSITINSIDELEKFKPESVKEFFEESSADEELTFELKYEDPKSIKNGEVTKHFSYKVGGNSNDIQSFLASIDKIKTSMRRVLKNKIK